MKCPKCGFENRSHARFCKQCGQSLPAQASPPPPSAPTNLICLACGSPVKPGARFCPRCGLPQPTAPPPPPPAQLPAYTPLPAQPPPPAYAQSPAMPPPFTAPQRHSPRWIWWMVGIAVFLCITVVAAAVLCEPKIIGTGEEPAPAAVSIALSNTDLRVGETLTVTAIVTNTGSAPLGNLLYQLVGEQAPLEEASEQRYEENVLPGETNVVTFALQANQEGTATLQVYVLMDVRTTSSFKESLLSEMRTVSITSQ